MAGRISIITHKIIWLLLLVQLFIYVFAGGLTIRAVWLNQILVALLFTTGLIMFFTIRKKLRVPGKLYLGIYPLYTGLLIISFVADRIFFIVCALPLWLLIL